jgi:hypothetical protein
MKILKALPRSKVQCHFNQRMIRELGIVVTSNPIIFTRVPDQNEGRGIIRIYI